MLKEGTIEKTHVFRLEEDKDLNTRAVLTLLSVRSTTDMEKSPKQQRSRR